MLWQGCHILRHEGVAYDEYVDQLSHLLFIKMSSELGERSFNTLSWSDLFAMEDEKLLEAYEHTLKTYANEPGIVGEIFEDAQSRFKTAASLRAVLRILDETHWSSLDRDVQGDAFEYLLERTASDGKQGAGQYFTPRPLVKAIVRCVRPGAKPSDRIISDPATGTGGFLVEAAREFQVAKPSVTNQPWVVGNEIVPRVRRMALMNLLLHGIASPRIVLGDALIGADSEGKNDIVIANPPFGARSGPRPARENFWVQTGNKQINFVQHIVRSLRPGGRAAIVLPDNCFAGDPTTTLLWREIFAENRVHTILRLPKGTFAPYAAGVMTNVVFISATGEPTEGTWIYDARTAFRQPTGRKPLESAELEEFIRCFGPDPDAGLVRQERTSPSGRWTRHEPSELESRNYKLDRAFSELAPRSTPDLDASLAAVEDELSTALGVVRELRRVTHG